jgi:16S rRNA G966 N2-methylase RsmD
MRFLKKNVADREFDIIFADPPYQRSEVRGQRSRGGGCEVLLKAIEDGGVLARGGVFVMEQAAETDSPAPENWLKTMEKVYGGTKLAFFEKEHAE